MATITKRAKGWFVQIRRKGYEPEFKTLPTKDAAEKWAREREGRIDRGEEPLDRRQLKGMTLGGLIRRYIEEVTPTKRGTDSERLRLAKMLGSPMCDIALLDLQSAHIAAYRDIRAKQVKPGTVARELGLLHTIIEVAKRDWGLSMPHNVVAQVRRLPVRNARDRRLRPGEFQRLNEALKETRNSLIRPAILFAIQTALRRGELLNLTWANINVDTRLAQ